MNRSGALLSVCFCAGALGALAASLLSWGFGTWGLPPLAEAVIAPQLEALWLYPRLIAGGLWGLAYFLTVGSLRTRRRWVRKGLFIGLLPAAFELFQLLPPQGPFVPLSLGLVVLLALASNLAWGFFTGLFTRLLWGRE